MDNKDNIKLNMRFTDINVIKYSQYDLIESFDKNNKTLVNFQSNFQFKVIPETESMACSVIVEIRIIETDELFSELKVQNIFEVKPLSKILNTKKENSYDIPNGLLNTIISLSISTVRGILSEKLKGTFIQNEVYPLIDPSKLIKNIN